MVENKITYGNRTFMHEDIVSGDCHLARDLLSASLEMNTLDFEVESNDTTLTNFVRNAPLTYYKDGQQVDIFYIQKVKRVARTRYTFECTSAMGLLDETDHYGGIYAGQTVAEVIKDICGSVPVLIKTNLEKIKLYGYLPKATRRANLSQVLFAVGATVKGDLNGNLRVEGLWDGISSIVDSDHVYENGTVEADTPVTKVVVTEHQYIRGGEVKKLFEGTTSEGDIITFDEPMHDLVADGFRILESGPNYARVSSGNGTLSGTAYIHNTREVSKVISQSGAENVVRVEDATLVSLANANAVAERLARYYAAREVVEQDVVYDGEIPGDVMSVAHPYGGAVETCMESADITMSGVLRATEKHLVGYKPPEVGEAEYYDNTILIIENGVFIVPDGVTSIRVVLIGGAQGGASGLAGESGQNDGQGNAGGKGGTGGSGGTGGKIYQIEMNVTPGQTFSVSIGIGGNGAPFSDGTVATGEYGSATTFGVLSSDNGSSSKTGFVDIFSGAVYAREGDTGMSGGDGGDGKKDETTDRGGDGQNVLSFLGGNGGEGRIYINSKGQLVVFSYGGGGGGAALGGNGADGSNGSLSFVDDVLGTGPGYLASGRNGGNGADATAMPVKPMARGNGGTGGHGGGGGGGGGHAEAQAVWNGRGGDGGRGGHGGAGGDGCVIVYYRTYNPFSSGLAIDRHGKIRLDSHARRMVV